ncbi:MAG: glycosyltransferase [Leptospiraceae bacterium]|nr:glycosyltransferase [Leptospiraceae bacterium]
MKDTYLTLLYIDKPETSLPETVKTISKYTEICLLDDYSEKGCREFLVHLQETYPESITILRMEAKSGLSKTLQKGMKYAAEKGYNYIITFDTDSSYDAESITSFLAHPPCDLVIGKRENQTNAPLLRRLLAFTTTRIMNYCMVDSLMNVVGPNLEDCTSSFRRYSYRAFNLLAKKELESSEEDFHIESLFIIQQNYGNVDEVEIPYLYKKNSPWTSKSMQNSLNYSLRLFKKKFGFKA